MIVPMYWLSDIVFSLKKKMSLCYLVAKFKNTRKFLELKKKKKINIDQDQIIIWKIKIILSIQ